MIETWRAVRYGSLHRVDETGRSVCGLVAADSNRWIDAPSQPKCVRCAAWVPIVHGTARGYSSGCPCDKCRTGNSEVERLRRWARREERDGAPTDRAAKHGRHTYTNHHCRCQVCVDDHRAHMRELRDRRRAARVLIGGRWVATTTERHGTEATYSNHSCRCAPCTAAATAYKAADYDRARRAS